MVVREVNYRKLFEAQLRTVAELGSQLIELERQRDAGLRNNERLQRELETRSVDRVTGLYPRAIFEDFYHKLFARAQRANHSSEAGTLAQPLSLIMLDIDHFKKVNDTYGHPVGDQVLGFIGEVILSSIRESDLAGRYSGEELIMVLPGCDQVAAAHLAMKVKSRIGMERFNINGGFHVTVSMGINSFVPGASPEVMVERSDKALYKAKEDGRDRIVIYGPDDKFHPVTADGPTMEA
jgi:diguanylate cyclase (GGDEF)-like protein